MKPLTSGLILAADAAIDLQMHTIYSDGEWTPEELIDYLVSERFGLVAVTDHDRVDAVGVLQELAAEKQLPLLAAVEMSTNWRGRGTDMLCYGFDPAQNEFHGLIQDIGRRQRENTREACENLLKCGIALPQHEIEAILAKASSQHFLALLALLQKLGNQDEEASIVMIFDAGFTWATIDIAAVVDATHRSGAVCLIAHPGRDGGGTTYDADLLDELRREVPIDGFEANYPDHSPEQIAMYRAYAETHGLLTSSGSDSHGPDRKPMKYRAEQSRRLLERLGIQIK